MAVAADTAELRIEPSLEEARELAAEGNVVPVRARFVDDCETPVSAFLKLRAGEPEGAPCFLLESAEQGQVGRYSVRRAAAALGAALERRDPLGVEREAAAAEPSRSTAPDPYAAVADRLGRTGRRRSRACRPSPAAPSASSATTWCARSSRWASPTRTRSGCPTWR